MPDASPPDPDGWGAPRLAPIPFETFRAELLGLYVPPLRAKATASGIRTMLGELAKLLGPDATTAGLTPALVARLVATRPPEMSPYSVRSLLVKVKIACNYAVSQGYLRSSPFAFRKNWIRVGAVRVARRLGLVDWGLDVELLRSEAYRDTTWPGLEGWRAILAAAQREAAGGSPRALRDLAMVRCLHDRGLRAVELLRLDVADCDLEKRRLAVVGKGKQERSWLTINAPAAEALAGWIRARGPERGALMTRTDPGRKGPADRLSHVTVWESVRRLGRLAGLATAARPHGLRHQATTRLLDLTGGDVRRVRKFTRHAKLDTVAIYDDNRSDFGGQLAELLGDDDAPGLR